MTIKRIEWVTQYYWHVWKEGWDYIFHEFFQMKKLCARCELLWPVVLYVHIWPINWKNWAMNSFPTSPDLTSSDYFFSPRLKKCSLEKDFTQMRRSTSKLEASHYWTGIEMLEHCCNKYITLDLEEEKKTHFDSKKIFSLGNL